MDSTYETGEVSISVDSEGNTIEFHLNKISGKQTTMDFFKKTWGFNPISESCMITVNKNPAYPIAIEL